MEQNSDNIFEGALNRFVFISPKLFLLAYLGSLCVALIAPVIAIAIPVSILMTAALHIGWAYASRKWLIKSSGSQPVLNARDSRALFLLSLAIILAFLVAQASGVSFTTSPTAQKTIGILATGSGMISVIGLYFFLFAAPVALVRAEEKPAEYGNSALKTFLMYLFLPVCIYRLQSRHRRLSAAHKFNTGFVSA